MPAEESDRDQLASVLERFGEPCGGSPGAEAVRFGNGNELTDIVRALDAEGLHVAKLTVHEPTLDDVFLAKTGRSLEGAGDQPAEHERGKMGAAA